MNLFTPLQRKIMKIRVNPDKTSLFQVMFLYHLNNTIHNLDDILENNQIEYFVMVQNGNNFEKEQYKLINYTLLNLGDIYIGYRNNDGNKPYIAQPLLVADKYGTMLDINGFKMLIRKAQLLDIPDFIHRVYSYTPEEGLWTTYNNPIYKAGLSLDNIGSITINKMRVDFFPHIPVEHLRRCFAL